MRQWKMYPVAGGWSGTYTKENVSAEVIGKNPQETVSLIFAKLKANNIDPDVDDIKYQLALQWYAREPARFITPPSMPKKPEQEKQKEGFSNSKLLTAVSNYLNLSYRTSTTHEDATNFLLEVLEDKRVGCEHCSKIVRQILKDSPKDWRYEIQKALHEHLGFTPQPKPLIEKSWLL